MSILLIAVLFVIVIINVLLYSRREFGWSFFVLISSVVVGYFLSPTVSAFIHADWRTILAVYVPAYVGVGALTALVKWIVFNFDYAKGLRRLKAKFDIKHPPEQQILKEEDQRERSRAQMVYEQNLERYTRQQNRSSAVQQFGDDGIAALGPFMCSPPTPPVFEPISDNQSMANRREAFVKYVQWHVGYESTDTNVSIDYTKSTAIVDALTPRAKQNVDLISVWVFQWPIVVIDMLISDLLIKLGKHIARLFDTAFSFVSRKLVANATRGL